MRTVVLGERPAELEAWLERRQALGQDRFDEVCEGEYHVAPMAHGRHRRVGHGRSGVTIWGIADAASRPEQAWQDADQNKLLWVFLQALGVAPFLLVGFLATIVYLTTIRPEVRAAQAQA